MIYALAALLLGVLAWATWLYYQGKRATKSETELEQVQELGSLLEEAVDELEEEAETALARARRRLRKRWDALRGRV